MSTSQEMVFHGFSESTMYIAWYMDNVTRKHHFLVTLAYQMMDEYFNSRLFLLQKTRELFMLKTKNENDLKKSNFYLYFKAL